MQKSIFFSAILALALMSGCSQKEPEVDAGGLVDANLNNAVNSDAVAGTGVDNGIETMTTMDSSSVAYATEDERIVAVENELQAVYFGTDRYDISATESEKIDIDATILNGDLASDLAVTIEGNCDEWGTDEYNYALGLKRAKSMKEALITSGVDGGRMSIVSFGESKPKCIDHNAECWQENRRADINTILP